MAIQIIILLLILVLREVKRVAELKTLVVKVGLE